MMWWCTLALAQDPEPPPEPPAEPAAEEPVEVPPVDEPLFEDEFFEEEAIEEPAPDEEPVGEISAEEMPEEVPDQPIEVVREDQGDELPANRGRVSMQGGIAQWLVPGPASHLGVQVHVTKMFAVNLEVAGTAVTVLDPDDGDRYLALLPTSVIGLTVDPVVGRLRPQVGVDLTATIWQFEPSQQRMGVAPGMRARAGVDVMIVGPLCWNLEGYAGSAFAANLSADINPRWPAFAPSSGLRTGVGVRW